MCGDKGGGIEETAEQQDLARIAAERWVNYKEMYLPVEQQYFDYVESFQSPGKIAQAEGVAAVNVESAFGDAVKEDVAELTSQGLDPSSGRFQTAIGDQTERRASARTDNTTRTGQAMQDTYLAGKQNIVAIGNNQSSDAISGFADVASSSGYEANRAAIADNYRDQGNAAAAGMVAGAGYAAYKNSPEDETA